MRLLVVEDERRLASALQKGLRAEGFDVDVALDGTLGLNLATEHAYDLIVLDIMLPGLNGLDVCRRIRAQAVDTPILMLTARENTLDRVAGLDSGADDYLTKPFAFDELLARMRAIVRRGRTRQLSAILEYGPVQLDPRDHTVRVAGARLDLTATEYRVLEQLMMHPETVVSREQLADRVWGGDLDPGSNVIEVYIGYLRRKLGDGDGDGGPIETVRNVGYRLRGPRA